MFTFLPLLICVCVVGEVIYVEVRGQFVGLGSSVTWILGIELRSSALVEKPLSADPSHQGRSSGIAPMKQATPYLQIKISKQKVFRKFMGRPIRSKHLYCREQILAPLMN